MTLCYEEINFSDDPRWTVWKQIYYDSFPENERMSEDFFLRVFNQKVSGAAEDKHVLIMSKVLETRTNPIGMAYYEFECDLRIAYLIFLATQRGHRNKRYGTAFYAELVKRMKNEGAKLLIFEVEMPELAENTDWAHRRIAWYRRHGAFVLDGIEYLAAGDMGLPPIPMFLMVHPFAHLDVEEIFSLAKSLFHRTLKQISPLSLT